MANEPVHVVRLGLIKCQVFLRKTKVGDRFNVTVNRLYKNGDHWQQSGYFRRDDLPLAIKASISRTLGCFPTKQVQRSENGIMTLTNQSTETAPPKALLKAGEVAEMLGISTRTLWRLSYMASATANPHWRQHEMAALGYRTVDC